ncbi:non-ribosomal peptide synthetase [Tahibacter sp.]|uniref:non-ribosomal peptide synthetase n=1 Tax=Tahibacter sp. TaxID=2056211 RepID=UPI0028C49055|nr:non-ribosomal peptide synthetase [Tahibacter sp.]
MDVNALLSELGNRRVRLIADGDKLRYEAPPGVVDANLLTALKAHKPALLSLLAESVAADAPDVLAVRIDRHAPRPLTWQQETLWVAERAQNGCRALHLPLLVHFDRAPDVARLEAAMHHVVQRHAELRSVFVESASGWMRQSLPAEAFSLHCVRRGGVLTRDDAALAQALRAFVDEPFDLLVKPPLRARLVLGDVDAVLCVVVHHTAADAVAVGVLLDDLAAAYDGRDDAERDDCVDYADFAVWQQRQRTAPKNRRDVDAYVELLGAIPPLNTLPTDRTRGATRSQQSGRVIRYLPEAQVAALERLAGQCGATLFMALHAVYCALLRRYADDDAVVIGVPFANRTVACSERIVGTFVNVLPLRVDVVHSDTFRSVLDKVRQFNRAVHEYQATPLEWLIERLGVARNASHHPLFQLTLGLQPDATRLTLGNASGRLWELDRAASQFDLGLDITRGTEVSRLRWEFDGGLFERQTVERLAEQFDAVLAAVIVAPTRALAEVWGTRSSDLPDAAVASADCRSLGLRFAAVAAEHPALPALVVGDLRLSFAQLEQRAAVLARWLQTKGVGPGCFVGISTTPIVDNYVCLLAVILAGAAYVPLDPAIPADRMASMLHDAGPRLVLADEALLLALRNTTMPVVATEDAVRGAHVASYAAPFAAVDIAPHLHPAYAIFTSGSTGQPKGVVVSHASVARLAAAEPWLRFEPGQSCLQSATLAFDAATYELWSAWLQGACVVVADRDLLLSPDALAGLVRSERIQAAFFTTALFNRLAVTSPTLFAGMRTVLFGGEAVTNTTVAAALQACPTTQFVHVYGPTENTTFSSGYPVQLTEASAVRPIPIGRVMRCDIGRILDVHGNPVPIGATGELHLGGAGLALGYLGGGARTAAAFVPDSDGPSGARLYRTGDIVRRLDGEVMEFVGRRDAQVKVNGYRIELEEIAAAMAACDEVAQCHIAVRADAAGNKCICCYVVQVPAATSDSAVLRAQAAAKLPSYMRPHHLWIVAELPLNRNGKVDVSLLPDPAQAPVTVADTRAWTAAERDIAVLWREVASVHADSPDSDFFVAGGDSLRAMAVWHAIQSRCGVQLSLKAFFAEPTVAATARIVQSPLPMSPKAPETPPPAPCVHGAWPMSPLQQDLFYEALLAPDSSAYNISLIADVDGPLQRNALHAACQRLAEKHLALRCTYAEEDGVFTQRPGAVAVPVTFDAARADRTRDVWERQGTSRPFDLENESPLRVRVLQYGDGHIVQLVVHHIACDALSLPVLMDDLRRDYLAIRSGNELPPVVPDSAYFVYAQLQSAFAESDDFAASLAAWREELHSYANVMNLGTPDDSSAGASLAGVAVSYAADELARIDEVCTLQACSRFEWLLATWFRACGAVLGADDLVITTTCSGRTRPEYAATVGYFVNMLPIRVSACRADQPSATLTVTRERLRGALTRQDVPYSRVRRLLARQGTDAAVAINFTYVGFGIDAGDWGDLTVTRMRAQSVDAKCAINLQLAVDGDALSGTLQFTPARTSRALATVLAARWRNACLESPQAASPCRQAEVTG